MYFHLIFLPKKKCLLSDSPSGWLDGFLCWVGVKKVVKFWLAHIFVLNPFSSPRSKGMVVRPAFTATPHPLLPYVAKPICVSFAVGLKHFEDFRALISSWTHGLSILTHIRYKETASGRPPRVTDAGRTSLTSRGAGPHHGFRLVVRAEQDACFTA